MKPVRRLTPNAVARPMEILASWNRCYYLMIVKWNDGVRSEYLPPLLIGSRN